MTALSFVFALVAMLGVLIFVHELGHFLVAKWCGVRVLKFSLGFGPPIGIGRFRMAWTRGGTEYVIAWFPLGGFVKMLGENMDEGEDPEVLAHPEQTLEARPVWQKLAIVFAGPAMNLLLPVFVFTGNLAVGMQRPAPVIGTVEPGSPAAEAGLQPGDRILEAAGQPVTWWDELDAPLRARAEQAVSLTVARDGETFETRVTPEERSGLDEFGLVQDVGWAGIGHPRMKALLGIPETGAPAAEAGLRSGDLVVAVGDTPVEDWSGLASAYAAAEGPRVTLELERGDPESPETLRVDVPVREHLSDLGVVPASVLIASVTPDSPAERAGLAAGDLILTSDDEPVGSFAAFAERVRTSGGEPIAITYARDGASHRVTVEPELLSADTGMGIDEERYLIGITAEVTALQGALQVDRERNPLVAVPRAVAMTVDVTQRFLRGLGKLITGEVSRSQIAGPIGIAVIAHKALERGIEHYLSMLVLISINLGILNLLPIPVLDGGQAVIFAVEGIKRSPVSLRTREIVQQLGLMMIVLLMGMAFWNDISRYWSQLLDYVRSGAGL